MGAQLDDNTELEEADFEVSDIFTMLAHFAPQKHFKLHTYACSSLEDKRIFMTPQGGADLVLKRSTTGKDASRVLRRFLALQPILTNLIKQINHALIHLGTLRRAFANVTLNSQKQSA